MVARNLVFTAIVGCSRYDLADNDVLDLSHLEVRQWTQWWHRSVAMRCSNSGRTSRYEYYESQIATFGRYHRVRIPVISLAATYDSLKLGLL
jgi:hypothetical protein